MSKELDNWVLVKKTAMSDRHFFTMVDKRGWRAIRQALVKEGDTASVQMWDQATRDIAQKMSMPANYEMALLKMMNLIERGPRNAEMTRNQVFKIADLLDIKLPHGIFASEGMDDWVLVKKEARGGADSFLSETFQGYYYTLEAGERAATIAMRKRMKALPGAVQKIVKQNGNFNLKDVEVEEVHIPGDRYVEVGLDISLVNKNAADDPTETYHKLITLAKELGFNVNSDIKVNSKGPVQHILVDWSKTY